MSRSYGKRLVLIEDARIAGRRWRDYIGLIAITIMVLLFIGFFPWLRFRELLAGFVIGAIGVVIAASLARVAEPRVVGQTAEGWTLETLRKSGGWLITSNLSFDGLDIDHVVVIPTAVLAVETKYRGKAFNGTVDQDRHQRELAAAERGARKLRLFLQSRKLRDAGEVLPVLIVWGPGSPDLPDGHRVEHQIRVLDAQRPELWAAFVDGVRFAEEQRRRTKVLRAALTRRHGKGAPQTARLVARGELSDARTPKSW